MNFIKQIERLQRLNRLISKEQTGTPDQLARRLSLKRSQLYETLDLLKFHGAPIKYSRKLCTFYYTEPFSLEINFQITVLSGNEERKIYGGGTMKEGRKVFPSDEIGSGTTNFPLLALSRSAVDTAA